jgi:hypothetical protein
VGHHDVNLERNQLGGEIVISRVLLRRKPGLKNYVLLLNIAKLAQTLPKRFQDAGGRVLEPAKNAYFWDFRTLLRFGETPS